MTQVTRIHLARLQCCTEGIKFLWRYTGCYSLKGVTVLACYILQWCRKFSTTGGHNNLSGHICIKARTNVVTFECSFVFVTFVSRFFVTKHSFISIMFKIHVKNLHTIEKLIITYGCNHFIVTYLVF